MNVNKHLNTRTRPTLSHAIVYITCGQFASAKNNGDSPMSREHFQPVAVSPASKNIAIDLLVSCAPALCLPCPLSKLHAAPLQVGFLSACVFFLCSTSAWLHPGRMTPRRLIWRLHLETAAAFGFKHGVRSRNNMKQPLTLSLSKEKKTWIRNSPVGHHIVKYHQQQITLP